MGHKFAEIAFTPTVKKVQEQNGSRRSYARLEDGDAHHDRLGAREAAFIAERDSFYMATVSQTGWPYIQHRGGPPGFVRILDEKTIGFADFDLCSDAACRSVNARQRDVPAQQGRAASAGDFADLAAVRVLQFCVLTHRDALQRNQADALALHQRGVLQLRQHLHQLRRTSRR